MERPKGRGRFSVVFEQQYYRSGPGRHPLFLLYKCLKSMMGFLTPKKEKKKIINLGPETPLIFYYFAFIYLIFFGGHIGDYGPISLDTNSDFKKAVFLVNIGQFSFRDYFSFRFVFVLFSSFLQKYMCVRRILWLPFCFLSVFQIEWQT